MAAKISIKKVLIFLFWTVLAIGFIVLAMKAADKREKELCQGFELRFVSDESLLFIDKKELTQLLTANGKLVFKGKPVASIDLRKMEAKLEKNRWIQNADLYFDNLQVLQVVVQERIPVARVFTTKGQSFYLDTASVWLPLSDKVTARLPLFTSFPHTTGKWSGRDSLLVRQIVDLSGYLTRDPLWVAQIAQVDITPDYNFELLPMLGNHVMELGEGVDLEQKFSKLRLFYEKVLSSKGLDAYERIKLQFKGQVVGVRSPTVLSKADSIQAIKNVEEMIRKSHEEREQMLLQDTVKKEGN